MSLGCGQSWRNDLFGDPEIEAILSADADLKRMLTVEAAWTRALGQSGAIDLERAENVAIRIENASIDYAKLCEGSARDGLPVPVLVQQLKHSLNDVDEASIHAGLSSQDVIDTSLVLALNAVLPIIEQRLNDVVSALHELRLRDGHRRLMAHTRMQPALPFRAADRIDNWTRPLLALSKQSVDVLEQIAIIQWGGAIGVRDSDLTEQQGELFAKILGLRDPGHAWHTDRSVLGDLANYLSKITGAVGKIAQDLALQAQNGIDDLKLNGGGSSSAMPHKNNPVLAELLITLARYNAGLVAQLHGSLVHEQERSGTAWMIEWLVLPQMLTSTGRSLVGMQRLLTQVERLGL